MEAYRNIGLALESYKYKINVKIYSKQHTINSLRRRYVRTVKIGDKWNTYLQIDHQGFCVVEQTSYRRARWFGKNLAIALKRMLATNKN